MWITGVAVIAVVSLTGVWAMRRKADDNEIRSVYSEFRSAMLAGDFRKAETFLTTGERLAEPPEARLLTYGAITNSRVQLTKESWVEHTRAHVWFYPSGTQPGSIGYGFVKDANGWRLDGQIIAVQH
jgi:hypothetical protein